MRIVADTNTVLSGLLWGGPPRRLIDLARARSLSLHTSVILLAELAEVIARDKFAPFNRVADVEEPRFDGEKVILPASSHAAAQAYVESGMLAAAQDYELGGMQLPCVVEMAAHAFFSKAGIGLGGGGMLTSGNANLLMVHGTPLQKKVFAQSEFAGRWFGTMCLSEPQAGSSLSDITTRAIPDVFQDVERVEQTADGALVGLLGRREARSIHAVIDVFVNRVVQPIDVGPQVGGVQIRTARGKFMKFAVEHAHEIVVGIADDPTGHGVPQNRYGNARAIGWVGCRIGFGQIVKSIDRISGMAGTISKGPPPLIAYRIDRGQAYNVLQPHELAHDDGSMRPRASPGNVEMIPMGRRRIAR